MSTTTPIARAALVLLLCFGLAIRQASAQPQADAPWDPLDPVNLAETRQWFSRCWQAEQTGDWEMAMGGFTWTNDPPREKYTLLLPAIQLFRQLYASQLNIGLPTEDAYDVLDLVDDDETVRARFRHYLATGILETSVEEAPELVLEHLNLISESGVPESGIVLEGQVWVENGSIVSSGLMIVGQPGTPTPQPAPPAEPADTFEEKLRCLVTQSFLLCMGVNDLYFPDKTRNPIEYEKYKNDPEYKKLPDFDCDDFALAMEAWLKKRLGTDFQQDLSVKHMHQCWTCRETDAQGHTKTVTQCHALVCVTDKSSNPRKFYYIEPSCGTVAGPFESTTPQDTLKQKVKELLRGCLEICQDAQVLTPEFTDPAKGLDKYGENPPWWKDCSLPANDPRKDKIDKDMCYRFKEKLRKCCNETRHPACGTTPAGRAPEPCDSVDPFIWQ